MKVLVAIVWNTIIVSIIGSIQVWILWFLIKWTFGDYVFARTWIIYIYNKLASFTNYMLSVSPESVNEVFVIVVAISMAFVTITSLIVATRIGDFFLKIPMSLRKPSIRELSRINPLLENVLNTVETVYYKKIKINVLIADCLITNIFILGYNTLVVTKGMLKHCSDAEIQAIFAHEIAHIYYGKSIHTSFILGADLCGVLAMKSLIYITNICQYIINACNKNFIKVSFFSFVAVVFSTLIFLIKIINCIYYLIYKWLVRRSEFIADEFVVSLGMGDGLMIFLSKESEKEIREHGFWKKYNETRPSLEERVNAILISNV